MWMSPEDARSDFILAAATTLFGPLLVNLVVSLPFYPSGFVGDVLGLVWIVVMTALVPVLLVRYRDQDLTGYGLVGDPSTWTRGLVVALPVIVVGWLRGWLALSLGPIRALAGSLGYARADPVIGSSRGVADLALDAAFVIVVFLSALILVGFLVTRARDGFRRTELPLVEAVRTFGLGSAAAGFAIGSLASLTPDVRFTQVLASVAALVGVLLLTDRLVDPADTTSRLTLLAPAAVAVIAQVMAFGGIFRGNLLLGLYFGALTAGLVIALGAILETRRVAWAVVPLAAAAALYPTCLSLPVAFNAALAGAAC